MVKQYPHLMERYPDYHSASVLGKIYDEVKSQESEADPSISKWLISLISLFPLTTEMVTNFLLFSTLFFFLLLSEIVPLQCFTEVAVSEDYKRRWTSLYQEYLRESSKLCKLEDKAERNINFHELYQEYKWVSILLPNGRHLKFKGCPKSRQVFFSCGILQVLYKVEEFEYSLRERFDLFNEACAVYQVVYEHATSCNQVSKCGFAWKVAGRALCQLYTLKHSGDTMLCSFSILEGAFKKNHRT